MPDIYSDEFLPSLTTQQKLKIYKLLADCSALATPGDRQAVTKILPTNIQNSLTSAPLSDRLKDILRIVDCCRQFPGGWKDFLNALEFFDGENIPFQNLHAFLQTISEPQNSVKSGQATVLDLEETFNKAIEEKNWEKAARYGKQLREQGHDGAIFQKKLGEAFYQHGLIFINDLGNYQRGLEELNAAIELVKNKGEYYYWRGRLFAQLEQQETALGDLNHAVFLGYQPASELLHSVEPLINNQNLEHADPEIARTAAEKKLRERLRSSLIPIKSNIAISDFITHAEYQLFLNDKMRNEQDYWQPAFWQTAYFPKNQANIAVIGLSALDAEEFCNWLTLFDENGYKYRLPNPLEARRLMSMGEIATWCKLEKEYNLVGLSTQTERIIWLKLERLCEKFINFTRPSDLDFDFTFNFDLTLSIDLALARAIDLNFALDLTLGRIQGQGRTLDLILARERAYTLARAADFDKVVTLLQKNNLQEALAETKKLCSDANNLTHKRAKLLCPLIKAQMAVEQNNIFAAREAGQCYTMLFAEYAYEGLQMKEKEEKIDLSKEKQAAIDLYFWARVQIERRENGFPAWEGLRVVREG